MSYSRWEMSESLVSRLAQIYGRSKPSDEEVQAFHRDYLAGCENGVPKGLNKTFTDREEKRLEEVRAISFPKREHISEFFLSKFILFHLLNGDLRKVLDMLMTKPAYQGKGAAAAHIEWGLKLANKENLPVFLEAGPAAKTLYLKFGFVVVGEVVHDLSRDGGTGEFVHSLMVRDARQ